MAVLLDTAPGVVENSVFGIWKAPGKVMQFMWSGNRSNQLFNDGASFCRFMTPDLLASLGFGCDDKLFLGGCDVSKNYNRMRLPVEMIPLLGCARVQ